VFLQCIKSEYNVIGITNVNVDYTVLQSTA